MNECVWFQVDSAIVVPAAVAALTRRGLQAVRSFDLRSALAANMACECPHHGLSPCDCQWVVMQIFGDTVQPVVLTVHGREAWTQVQIVRDATTVPDPRLAEQVVAALVEAALVVRSAPPVAAPATPASP